MEKGEESKAKIRIRILAEVRERKWALLKAVVHIRFP
jgi:hypothetical protein